MTWEQIDGQTGYPVVQKRRPQTEADLEGKERARLRHRDYLKGKVAEGRHAERIANEARETLNAIEGRLEDLAADHQVKVAPLQHELAQVEADQIRRIHQKLPADQKSDARRAELLEQIRAAGVELERATEDESRLYRQVETDYLRHRREATELLSNETDLRDWSSAALKSELEVATDALEWSRRRLAHCERLLAARKTKAWAAALDEAKAIFIAAESAVAKAIQAQIDE